MFHFIQIHSWWNILCIISLELFVNESVSVDFLFKARRPLLAIASQLFLTKLYWGLDSIKLGRVACPHLLNLFLEFWALYNFGKIMW